VISISSNMDGFAKDLMKQVQKEVEDAMVDELVAEARKDGLTNVDNIELTIQGEGAGLKIDRASVKRRANQKLSTGLPFSVGVPLSHSALRKSKGLLDR